MLPKSLKNYTMFVDGFGYAGRVAEGAPPKLALETQEFNGGGLGGTVDVSMGTVQKMDFEFTLEEFNPAVIGLFGQKDVPVTFRGVQGDDNEAVIIDTRSLMREIDQGTWKRGDKSALKIGATATYFYEEIAGQAVVEVDVENLVFISGGVDHMADVRAALGL